MYRTIRTVLRYNTIHMIHTLYRTIHEHLRYADMIWNFLHTIRYVSYDTYRVLYDTDNYGSKHHYLHISALLWARQIGTLYLCSWR